jgi:hypothetical protein
MANVPLSWTVAPGCTLTIRLSTPAPAWKPVGAVPVQLTVWPLTAVAEFGTQSAKAGDDASAGNSKAAPSARIARPLATRPIGGDQLLFRSQARDLLWSDRPEIEAQNRLLAHIIHGPL